MKALIFWGGWEGHQPRECAQIVKGLLAENGVAIDVADSTAALAEGDLLLTYDLIVPIFTMATIADKEAENLARAVVQGSGLAGFHGGMGDSFRTNTTYQFIVGGQFVAHPGGVIPYRVNIVKPEDPIMAGLNDFEYVSEQYYMHVDPGNEVLATTTFSGEHASWTKGVVMPVVWKRRHGAGRVFYCSLGHQAAEFENHSMRTVILRGMLWAMRGGSGGDTP